MANRSRTRANTVRRQAISVLNSQTDVSTLPIVFTVSNRDEKDRYIAKRFNLTGRMPITMCIITSNSTEVSDGISEGSQTETA